MFKGRRKAATPPDRATMVGIYRQMTAKGTLRQVRRAPQKAFGEVCGKLAAAPEADRNFSGRQGLSSHPLIVRIMPDR
jgi:hypothetical protein